MAARLRHEAVQDRTACVNRIRGMLAQIGVRVRGAGFRSTTARAKLDEVAANAKGVLRHGLLLHLEQLDRFGAMIATWDRELARLAEALPDVEALEQQIPGVGRVLAAVIAGEAGELQRFASAKAFAAYTGMTPSCRMSAGKYARTGISREGSSLLRYALTQAVMALYPRARR